MPDETAGSITVGVRIRSAREAAGLTQEELAGKLGVTQTAVSYWESGKRDLGVADLERIAFALGVRAWTLLPVPHQPETAPPSLPDGEYARVEVMGHDQHTGWVSDGTRAGVPVLVVKDWDGRTIAEIPGGSLYRYVPLPTPLKRPEPQPALPARTFAYATDDDYDEGGPF